MNKKTPPTELNFSLEIATRPVCIEGENYTLKELDGKSRDKYMANLSKRMRTDAKGKSTVKDFEGIQATLISMSLFKDGEDLPVPVAVVQTWPGQVVATLHEAAKALSGLDKLDTEGKD